MTAFPPIFLLYLTIPAIYVTGIHGYQVRARQQVWYYRRFVMWRIYIIAGSSQTDAVQTIHIFPDTSSNH
jgi:hypothetical protein